MGRTSTYPIEFRQQAASLVIDGGRSVRDVARDLGINHETLRSWVTRARKDRAAVPAVLGDDERMELARLRRRVAEVEPEKEILMEAAVFFACETGRSTSSRCWSSSNQLKGDEDRLPRPGPVPSPRHRPQHLLRLSRPRPRPYTCGTG